MGNQCCRTAKEPPVIFTDVTSSDLLALAYEGPLLVRLVHANNVPHMDVASPSDVYVNAELIEPSGEQVGTAKWPVKWSCSDPRWESARIFGDRPPATNAKLRLHFYDKDDSNADDYIGTTDVKVSLIKSTATELPIALHHKTKPLKAGPPTCTILREPISRYQVRSGAPKVIYVVRHGESVWNKAQADKQFYTMLSATDHPLNETGRQQAESLCASLKAGGAHADEMLKAERVMCSPLTRAIQTCLIGIEPLLLRPFGGDGVQSGTKVHLNPNLREKRNAGGKDSSGKWYGDDVTKGVHDALDKLLADKPDVLSALKGVPLGLEHVQDKWWLGSKESEGSVKERIAELLYQLRFDTACSQVLVGHSHYFRELFRHFAAGHCTLADGTGQPLPTEEMTSKKLSNAGVAKCVLDFENHPEQPVVSVQLLFETQLVS